MAGSPQTGVHRFSCTVGDGSHQGHDVLVGTSQTYSMGLTAREVSGIDPTILPMIGVMALNVDRVSTTARQPISLAPPPLHRVAAAVFVQLSCAAVDIAESLKHTRTPLGSASSVIAIDDVRAWAWTAGHGLVDDGQAAGLAGALGGRAVLEDRPPEVDDAEQDEQHHRQDQRELDEALASLAPRRRSWTHRDRRAGAATGRVQEAARERLIVDGVVAVAVGRS